MKTMNELMSKIDAINMEHRINMANAVNRVWQKGLELEDDIEDGFETNEECLERNRRIRVVWDEAHTLSLDLFYAGRLHVAKDGQLQEKISCQSYDGVRRHRWVEVRSIDGNQRFLLGYYNARWPDDGR